MRVSMERLLKGVIDFAGTFPPAQLSTTGAFARYLSAQAGPESFLLGRYVCATSNLIELAETVVRSGLSPGSALTGGPQPSPSGREREIFIPICAVARPAVDQAGWEEGLSEDAARMNEYHRIVGDRAEIVAYEVCPPDRCDLEARLAELSGFREAEIYVELPLNMQVEDPLALLADSEGFGAKARLGGVEPGAIPSARALAQFVKACVDMELPFKLTAGLHHPLPDPDFSRISTHGFINVLTATALALAEDFSSRELEEVLTDADPADWRFTDRDLTWREFRIDLETIDEARTLFVAFGSCSLDEPMAGLRAAWGN